MSDAWGIPTPQWARDGLFEALANGPQGGKGKKGRKRGKRPETEFRHARLFIPIYASIQLARGRTIEPDLFDEVGEKFDISGRTASRIYYAGAPLIEPALSLFQESLSSAYGEEVAALTMSSMLAFWQRLAPGESMTFGLKAAEIEKRDGISKYEEMFEFAVRAIPDLSEIVKKLTKTS